jgi:hypothetical protein
LLNQGEFDVTSPANPAVTTGLLTSVLPFSDLGDTETTEATVDMVEFSNFAGYIAFFVFGMIFSFFKAVGTIMGKATKHPTLFCMAVMIIC